MKKTKAGKPSAPPPNPQNIRKPAPRGKKGSKGKA